MNKSIKDISEQLFQFTWGICEDGYEISFVKGNPNPKVILSGERSRDERDILEKSNRMKFYNPFVDTPELARHFATLCRDENGIIEEQSALKFANKYGLLGVVNESIEEWSEYSNFLKLLFDSLDQKKNGVECAKTIFNESDITPRFSIKIEGENSGAKHKRYLQIFPQRLIAAMWLMAAEELTKGVSMKACQRIGCSGWTSARSNKKYCSSACKQAAYRIKKTQPF